MKKIDLGQSVSVLANICVIVGIIVLVLELRQNNSILQATSRETVRLADLSLLNSAVENPDLWLNLMNPDMTDREKVQISAYLMSVVRQYELAWFQYRNDALDERAWLSNQAGITDLLSYSESRKWWQTFSEFDFDPEFVGYIDGLLENEPLRTTITDVRAFD